MHRGQARSVESDCQRVDFRVKTSKTAKQLRLRVNLDGVDVLPPADRDLTELDAFVREHLDWVHHEMQRIERLRNIRNPIQRPRGQLLFHGRQTPVVIEPVARRAGTNKVHFDGVRIIVIRGAQSCTSPEKTLKSISADKGSGTRLRFFG